MFGPIPVEIKLSIAECSFDSEKIPLFVRDDSYPRFSFGAKREIDITRYD
jgi:hypothetical protein